MYVGDSGNRFEAGSSFGFENIKFPFNLLINYKTWNTLHTS